MRRRLARDGALLVVLTDGDGAKVRGIGLPLDEDYEEFVEEARGDIAKALQRLKGRERQNPEARLEAARLAARRAAQRWSGKKPQTIVMQA
jgi:ribonuclease J